MVGKQLQQRMEELFQACQEAGVPMDVDTIMAFGIAAGMIAEKLAIRAGKQHEAGDIEVIQDLGDAFGNAFIIGIGITTKDADLKAEIKAYTDRAAVSLRAFV